jgi:hypothetical protein
MKKIINIRFVLVLIVSICGTINAQIPRTFSYQGVVTNTMGIPWSDGSYNITVRLYEKSNGDAPVFQEEHITELKNGIFSIVIGKNKVIPDDIQFNKVYYLGVSLNDGAEFTPRTELTSTPYSLRSEKAGMSEYAKDLLPEARVVRDVNGVTGNVNIIGGKGIEIERLNDSSIVIHSDMQTQSSDKGGNKLQLSSGYFTGDLSGQWNVNNSNWYVTLLPAAVTMNKINQSGATTGQVITTGSSNPVGAAGGSLSGNYPNPTIAANAINASQLSPGSVTLNKINTSGASSNQVVTFDGSSTVWSSIPLTGTAGGDLSGNYPNPTIGSNAITTAKINDGAVTDDKITSLSYAKITGAPSSLPPSGAAGGDFTGTFPNPSITSNAVTTTKINDGAVTSSKLSNTGVTAATYGDTNKVARVTVDAQGRVTSVTERNVRDSRVTWVQAYSRTYNLDLPALNNSGGPSVYSWDVSFPEAEPGCTVIVNPTSNITDRLTITPFWQAAQTIRVEFRAHGVTDEPTKTFRVTVINW